jgi:hypothetical protein
MRTYTAHIKPDGPAVLLLEGWSWGAALFGPLWLLAHRAWVPAVLHLAASVVLLVVVPSGLVWLVVTVIALLTGLLGRDLVRWSLARRGFALVHVLAARDEDAALGRLLAARTDLAERLA